MPRRGHRVMKRARVPWEGTVGHEPFLVWYGERPDKGYRVYLRWRRPSADADAARRTNWAWLSLRLTVRDSAGVVDQTVAAAVVRRAMEQHRALSGEIALPASAAVSIEILTLGATWAIVSDVETGSLPIKTPYRDEMEKALRFARRTLGDGFAWVDLDYEQFQKLVRARADGARRPAMPARDGKPARPVQPGLRAASAMGARILTLVGLLKRKHRRIPAHAPIPSGRGWREDLTQYVAVRYHGGDVPEPHQPRHSLEEIGRIFDAAPRVDARLALLLELGAEYRSGQVVRSTRKQLDMSVSEPTFVVRGRGQKRGTTVVLTDDQVAAARAALTGYLRHLERLYTSGALADYPLFPAGYLTHGAGPFAGRRITGLGAVVDPVLLVPADGTVALRPASEWWANGRFHKAERLAGVPRRYGLAFYGLRRRLHDATVEAGASEEAAEEGGGWTPGSATPKKTYRDKERVKARREASTVRGLVRREARRLALGTADAIPPPAGGEDGPASG